MKINKREYIFNKALNIIEKESSRFNVTESGSISIKCSDTLNSSATKRAMRAIPKIIN